MARSKDSEYSRKGIVKSRKQKNAKKRQVMDLNMKLKVTALPGLEVRLSGKENVRTTHRKLSIVEVEMLSGSIVKDIDLTIVAPDRPVELLFSNGKAAQMALLLLNKYGPEKYRTGFNASFKMRSVRSFRDTNRD